MTPLHRELLALPAPGISPGAVCSRPRCRLCPSGLAGKSGCCAWVSPPVTPPAANGVGLEPGAGGGAACRQCRQSPGTRVLGQGLFSCRGLPELGGLHSPLPQAPAGQGLGAPCRHVPGPSAQHEQGAAGGSVLQVLLHLGTAWSWGCGTQCRSSPLPIPWAGENPGTLRWHCSRAVATGRSAVPTSAHRCGPGGGHFWQVTHPTYLGAGADGHTAPRGAHPLPGQQREP